MFASAGSGETGESPLPSGVVVGTLAFATVLIALVSEVFVDSVQQAALSSTWKRCIHGFAVYAEGATRSAASHTLQPN